MGVCCTTKSDDTMRQNSMISKGSMDISRNINNKPISSIFVDKKRYSKIKNSYILKEYLGKGAYGIVQKVIHKLSGDVRAMKSISREFLQSGEEKKLDKEIEILKKLDHPNILKIYEFYFDSKNYYIITEYCKGGELFDKINELGTFSEKLAASILKQILQGIAYCHSNGVVHRDLKPENILIESFNTENKSFNIKIIDFGASSTFKTKQKLTEKTGTVR